MMFESLIKALPRLRNQFGLVGFIVAIGAFVAVRTIAPGSIHAQISAGSIGVCFIIFGQVFYFLKDIPEDDRAKLIIRMFIIFCVFTLSLIAATAYFIIKRDVDPAISIFKGKVHLGDNTFARIGGNSLPTIDDPLSQGGQEIVFYDKETKSVKTSFGLPTCVQILANHYLPIFENVNLDAWKHISVLKDMNDFSPTYENASVKIDFATTLIWIEDATVNGQGHFYSRLAPFARTKTLNIFNELKKIGFHPEGRRLAGAIFTITGLHGSRRPDQPDNINLIVNQKIYPIPFKSLMARNEEVVSIHIDTSSFSLDPDKNTMFSIVVLPFKEKAPLPPPTHKYREGPAHFRDVEVGDCSLNFTFKST